jgi:hypothetical protein
MISEALFFFLQSYIDPYFDKKMTIEEPLAIQTPKNTQLPEDKMKGDIYIKIPDELIKNISLHSIPKNAISHRPKHFFHTIETFLKAHDDTLTYKNLSHKSLALFSKRFLDEEEKKFIHTHFPSISSFFYALTKPFIHCFYRLKRDAIEEGCVLSHIQTNNFKKAGQNAYNQLIYYEDRLYFMTLIDKQKDFKIAHKMPYFSQELERNSQQEKAHCLKKVRLFNQWHHTLFHMHQMDKILSALLLIAQAHKNSCIGNYMKKVLSYEREKLWASLHNALYHTRTQGYITGYGEEKLNQCLRWFYPAQTPPLFKDVMEHLLKTKNLEKVFWCRDAISAVNSTDFLKINIKKEDLSLPSIPAPSHYMDVLLSMPDASVYGSMVDCLQKALNLQKNAVDYLNNVRDNPKTYSSIKDFHALKQAEDALYVLTFTSKTLIGTYNQTCHDLNVKDQQPLWTRFINSTIRKTLRYSMDGEIRDSKKISMEKALEDLDYAHSQCEKALEAFEREPQTAQLKPLNLKDNYF